jgi:hypothetical protein
MWCGVTACHPTAQLTVQPRRLCVGQSAIVSWRTRGRPTLSVAARPDSSHAIPVHTTFVLISVSHGDTARSSFDALYYPASGGDVTLDIATKPYTPDSIIAADSTLQDDWGDHLRIASIASRSDRALRVVHGGRTILLDVGGSSDAFAGLAYYGLWTMRAATLAGEVMGDPRHHPPTDLELDVHLTCGSEGSAR